jgi:hypothetical protein
MSKKTPDKPDIAALFGKNLQPEETLFHGFDNWTSRRR